MHAACMQVNKSPFTDGWIIKVKLSSPAELGTLMDADAYKAECDKAH